MSHAILIGKQTLRFPGCRAQYIKNVCTVRANSVIGNNAAELVRKHLGDVMIHRWRWEVEDTIRRST